MTLTGRGTHMQVVRAIGVAIVDHGSMYPPMELLLRSAPPALCYRWASATFALLRPAHPGRYA
jgi:hypothetical protein